MTTADIVDSMRALATKARAAARELARADRAKKDAALHAVAERLRTGAPAILEANRVDVARYRETPSATAAFVDRLTLTEQRLEGAIRAVLDIARQDDPVGVVTGLTRRPNGILVGQVTIPLRVIAIIYEARPNVTVDAAALCIKSGNAALLRGGSEAARSNAALADVLRQGLSDAGLPADAVQVVPPGDREAMKALLGMTGLVDLVIPRGGEGLLRFLSQH